MTDIWDEKPHYVWVPRGYFSKVRIKDDDIQMLKLEEMDAWLEKLMMDYEDRLLKMRNKIEQLLNDIGAAQGFKVRPLESKARDDD